MRQMRQMRQEMRQMRQGMRQGMRQIICLICVIFFIACLICLIVLIPCLILGFLCQIGCTDHHKETRKRKPGYFHLTVNASPGLCFDIACILRGWMYPWLREESEPGFDDGIKKQLRELKRPWEPQHQPQSRMNISQMQRLVKCFTKETPDQADARNQFCAVVIRGKKMGRIRQA